jgi:hypothetical protein
VKPGTRALGVAESYRGRSADGSAGASPESVLAGAVVRGDRVVDGLAFETCSIGGTDATTAIRSLVRSLGRADVRYLLLAGIAPAWFNVVDVRGLAAALDRPVLSVSFESSPGLEAALREHFDGEALADRLETYRAQPRRRPVEFDGDDRVFVRAAGCDAETATRVVREFTPEGGRPEPLRVARLAARAGRQWRVD